MNLKSSYLGQYYEILHRIIPDYAFLAPEPFYITQRKTTIILTKLYNFYNIVFSINIDFFYVIFCTISMLILRFLICF